MADPARQPAHDDGVDTFSAAPDAIVVVDEIGLITAVNDQACDLFGYDRAELIGHTVEILLPARFAAPHIAHRRAYSERPTRRSMGETLQLFGRHKSGEEFAVDVSLNFERSPERGLRVIAFVRDATARHRMEEELRKSEEGFRLLVEGAADHAIFMLDPSGRVITWNPGAERIKAWRSDAILGRHFSVFYVPADVSSGQPDRDLERAAAEGRAQSEGWRVRGNGQLFWAETTLSAVRDEAGTLRGFAKVTRDRTESHQARARLESLGELNRAVLERRPEEELLALVASRARAMVNATLVAAWAAAEDDDALLAVYAEGDGTSAVRGTEAAEDSVVATVARSTRAELAPDLKADLRVSRALIDAGLGSGFFFPLHATGETFGVIGVMMAREREPLQPHEADMLQAFGLQAAASFAHARARRAADQLGVVSERERIARDLHDSVIQRLFAVGMLLEATGRRPAAETRDRLRRAVADIDDTIRSIRTSIFSLETHEEESSGLRGQVLDVVANATPALTFEPSVRFDGPVETRATPEMTEHLVAVLREALSNVARHAKASAVDIRVTANGDLVLIVDDDGVGADDFRRDGGHGVANLRERARALGGDATISRRSPHGTRVEWRVPAPS